MTISRTFDFLELYKTKYNLPNAFATKSNGNWTYLSSKEYVELVDYFSLGLLSLGYKQGDKIAIVSNNRYEWNIVDMGMAQIGVVSVPIFPTASLSSFLFIFWNTSPKSVFVSDRLVYEKIKLIVAKDPKIEMMYTFQQVKDTHNWSEIIELGKKADQTLKDSLQKRKSMVLPNDLLTILHTSGTTGKQKGVMLSHNNICSNAIATTKHNYLKTGDKALSILPLSHVYERMMNYHYQYKGICIYYAENMGTIMEDMAEVKPQIYTTMPRMLERYYDDLELKIKSKTGFRKRIFINAIKSVASHYTRHKYERNIWFRLKTNLYRKLIFDDCIKVFGGKLKTIVSGDTTLQDRLRNFFEAAGIYIVEGYGMTETSPVIAVTDAKYREGCRGTSGKPIDGVEVKISEDGEILCKGSNIMLGYFGEPILTSEVIDQDGWFHTGDVGMLINDTFLKVTGRKNERFKLKNSDVWISPHTIESLLRVPSLIDTAMVIGKDQPYPIALISPSFTYLHQWAVQHGIESRNNIDLIANPIVIEKYQQEINAVNKLLMPHEQIKLFKLVPDEWSVYSGEISPTLKLRRSFVYEKYKFMIEKMYASIV